MDIVCTLRVWQRRPSGDRETVARSGLSVANHGAHTHNTFMRHVAACGVIGMICFLAGCLPTYVGNPDTAVVKPEYVGVWFREEGGDTQVWAVHKMNERNYLIQSYNIKTVDGKLTLDSTLAWRAWLADVGGAEFVSMEAFSTEQLLETEHDTNRYTVGRVKLDAGALKLRSIDPKLLQGQNVTTPQQFEALLKNNLDGEGVYLDEMTFTKVDEKNRAKLAPVLELVK